MATQSVSSLCGSVSSRTHRMGSVREIIGSAIAVPGMVDGGGMEDGRRAGWVV